MTAVVVLDETGLLWLLLELLVVAAILLLRLCIGSCIVDNACSKECASSQNETAVTDKVKVAKAK